jgi:flagellar motility protein MotE (MotC chaperone)
MTIGHNPARSTPSRFAKRPAALLVFLCVCGSASSGVRAESQQKAVASNNSDQQQYCSNIAASSEVLRLERRRKELSELETQLNARLAALDSKRNDLRALLDKLDAFEKKSGDALIGLYSRMKPEAAAAQIMQLDDDVAASLMLQLKTKISSAILGEMEAGRGAALAKRIAQLRGPKNGKKP